MTNPILSQGKNLGRATSSVDNRNTIAHGTQYNLAATKSHLDGGACDYVLNRVNKRSKVFRKE